MEKQNFSCMKCKSGNTAHGFREDENKVFVKCLDCGFELKYEIVGNSVNMYFDPEELGEDNNEYEK